MGDLMDNNKDEFQEYMLILFIVVFMKITPAHGHIGRTTGVAYGKTARMNGR